MVFSTVRRWLGTFVTQQRDVPEIQLRSGDFKIDLSGNKLSDDHPPAPADLAPIVVGIVLRRRRAAMIRRIERSATMWNFPGGKVGEGETHEEAVVRGLCEEIGLRCEVVKRICELPHPISGHTITYLLCKARGGKSQSLVRNKVEDIRWLTPKEVETVTNGTLSEAVRQTIAEQARFTR